MRVPNSRDDLRSMSPINPRNVDIPLMWVVPLSKLVAAGSGVWLRQYLGPVARPTAGLTDSAVTDTAAAADG